MATIVDTLITEYKLAGDYTQKANGVVGATDKVRTSFSSAESAAKGVFNVLAIGAATIVGFGAAAIGAGVKTMGMAAEFDTLERSFAGVYGSLDAGKNAMRGIEEYSLRSAYGLREMAEASKMLAAGGLSVKEYLPIVERYAQAIFGKDPQGLAQVASAFLRVKGGQFGEASETFRRGGIGANEFRSVGIQVSKSGEIKATVDEFLAALKTLSGGRIKAMAEEVAKGDAVKISNASDALDSAFRSVGSVLNKQFLPIVEKVTGGLSDFTNAGGFSLLAENVTNFNVSTGDTEGALVSFGANLIRARDIVGTVGTGFVMIGNALGAAWDWLNTPLGGDKKMQSSNFDLGAAFYDLFSANADNYVRDYEAKKKQRTMMGPAELPGAPPTDPLVPELPKMEDYMRRTAEATEKQLDITKSQLGGSNQAKYAGNAVNLSRAGRTGDRVESAIRVLADTLREEIFGAQLIQARLSPR